jgi:hypothetical protein
LGIEKNGCEKKNQPLFACTEFIRKLTRHQEKTLNFVIFFDWIILRERNESKVDDAPSRVIAKTKWGEKFALT